MSRAQKNLDEFCNRDQLRDIDNVVEIGAKCAAALDHAHRNGAVHRDLKPKNLLLAPDGNIKLAGFNIALVTGRDTTDTLDTTTPGSPLYMSPEQINGEEITGQSDLF